MAVDAEHLIVGAGCAGLSLAVRLASRPFRERGRIRVVDPRTEFGADRTWCAFRGAAHPFEDAVTHAWSRYRIHAPHVIERASERPYEHIASERFYAVALAALERAEGVELDLGVSVQALEDRGGFVEATTSAGSLRANVAWDGRGGAPAARGGPDDVAWWQHFVGWVVKTERPIFEPNVATLMDFRVSQRLGPHFVYVLPYARDEALVEDTYFSDTPLEPSRYEEAIRAWLDAHRAGEFTCLRTERGAIPMSTAVLGPRRDARIVPIGLRGGAAKPSTGYAFAFIQRHCEALARLAGDGSRPVPETPAHDPVSTAFDRVFLSFLRRHPERAPEVFGALFERTPPASLVRFLGEEGGVRDHLRVMNGVPRGPVFGEVLRAHRLWLRSR